MVLIAVLCIIGIAPLRPTQREDDIQPRWVFSGAVLGTLMVDSLFLLVATRF